jgi:Xaa-Pro dipeptidase
MDDEQQLYQDHITELRRRYDEVLECNGLDGLLIGAGHPHGIFLDDQHLPFKANPHLLQWGPLTEHPGSALFIPRGQTPELYVHMPTDFWHRTPPVPEIFEHSGLKINLGSDPKIAPGPSNRIAFIGEVLDEAHSFGIKTINPPDVLDSLNEFRTIKTPWEVANIRAASDIAIQGHLAAADCFAGGGSEYEIQLAFRAACGVTDEEMPYPAIVALNEHGSTLHYQRLTRQRQQNKSLLIDAGCAVNGYAADITRTHSDDAEFGALIEAMNELQRALCSAALPGVDYRELHHSAHAAITGLLCEIDVITADPQTALEAGLSRHFFPHGLGHFLGLQVHDVGALYARREANEQVPEGEDKYLRLTRKLAPGNIITCEPGIYFIDSLLDELQEKPQAAMINWQRVDQLRPFGGIRIEDNLHITGDSNENLTREAFAAVDA